MPIVPATADTIKEAARALARGDIVAFPTETVYGLGANALDGSAVAKIFAAKERPRFNPLIVHVPGLAEAETYGVVNAAARKLAGAFWPGPLSLVLEKRAGSRIADLVTAGLDTIALRSPAHPIARALLAEAKLPIAAPSANRSGRVSPTVAAHVAAELDDVPAMILDGGACKLGIESTVVSLVGNAPVLLRLGATPRGEIECVLGRKLSVPAPDAPIASPGQLATHYASSGWKRHAYAPMKRCSPSAMMCQKAPASPSISARAEISRKRRRDCSGHCGNSTKPVSAPSPSCRFPIAGSAKPSTTACGARLAAHLQDALAISHDA